MTIKGTSKIFIPLLMSAFIFLSMAGCGSEEKEEAKSMTRIQQEEGVPVKIDEISPQPFRKYLTFYSTITGIREQIRGAAIGGRISSVNAKPGQYVKKDDVIIEFPEDELSTQIIQAKAAFENAEKTFRRMENLLKAGETSQANYDGAETQYLVAKRNYEMQMQMLHIDAPYDGIITEIFVNEGDNVSSKDPLFKISNLRKMRTRLWATDEEIKWIKKGMTAEIMMEGESISGTVTNISLSYDPHRQAFYAEAEFPNENMKLRSGLTVEVRVLVYDNEEAIIVPRNVVRSDSKGSFIYLAKGDKAEKRYISNRNESGILYEINKGLSFGEKLITEGMSMVEDGQKIKVVR